MHHYTSFSFSLRLIRNAMKRPNSYTNLTTNITMSNNDVSGCSFAIAFSNDCNSLNITGNSIYSNDAGILLTDAGTSPWGTVYNNTAANNIFTTNNIYSNTNYGMQNPSGVAAVAENNWWGASDGPDDDAAVINGSGDKITIDFENRDLHLHLTEEEIAERFKNWSYEPKKLKGYLATYAKLANSANKGAILE